MSSIHRLPNNLMTDSVVNNENMCESNDTNEELNNGKAFGKYFEAIHITNEGQVIIASSNLFGPQLNGFVTKFNRIVDVPMDPVLSLSPNYGGICNLIGTRDKRFICGFDSGHISLLNNDLEEYVGVIYHDKHISRINLNKLQTQLVSCGHDLAIVVLDLKTFMPKNCYNYAHSAIIWDIDFNSIDDNILLSCGRDREVLMWDLKQSKPASRIASLISEPTALCWSSKDTSEAYVGCTSGQILTFDVRRPGIEIAAINTGSKSIQRLKTVFNGESLAVCTDSNVFKVYNSELYECIYEDSKSHTDWIRAVCEHNKCLYTVGRDTRLVCHQMESK